MRIRFLRMIPFTAVALVLAGGIANAAVWSAASTIAAGVTPVSAPAVASNNAGRTVASWVSNGQLVASLRDGVADWPAAVVLSAGASPVVQNKVVVAADGDVVAAWLEGAAASPVLKSASYTGGNWTLPATLSSSAHQFDLATDAAGNVTVAWTESAAGNTACAIRAASGTAATGFAAPSRLSGDCRNVLDLAVNSRGDAIVAWSNRLVVYGGSPVLVSQRNGAAGVWSLPVIVAGPTYRSHSAHVALADNGRAIALWSDAYGPRYARRRTNGNWSAAAAVDTAGGATYTGVTDIVMDASGNATALLGVFDMTFNWQPLVARHLDSGAAAWSKKTAVTAARSTIDNISVAANSNGSVIVGWFDGTVKRNGTQVGVGVSTCENGVWSRQSLPASGPSFAVGIANGSTTAVWVSGVGAAILNSLTAIVP